MGRGRKTNAPLIHSWSLTMGIGLDAHTIALGFVVFLARVFDVTMGTLRTISTVQGRTRAAFALGLLEVSMWLVVISTVIGEVAQRPILGVFYALGFSTGNVVGILVEQRIALGNLAIHIFSSKKGPELAARIRDLGLGVTTFEGQGKDGPVMMIFVVCNRKDYRNVVGLVRDIEPDAFFTTEQTGSVSKVLRPTMVPRTGCPEGSA
jgi:uncharacterized protein YebE (UPF0316 family)